MDSKTLEHSNNQVKARTTTGSSKTAKIFKDFYEENFDRVIASIERNKYYYDELIQLCEESL